MIRDFVIDQLALFSWREGQRLAPGSRAAARGVAFVIRNRVKEGGWHDGDWLKVIEASPIHSASEVSEMDFRTMPDLWHPDWRELFTSCQDIFDGATEDDVTTAAAANQKLAPPAMFYANLNAPLRLWFVDKIIRQPEEHPRTAECQPIVFFA